MDRDKEREIEDSRKKQLGLEWEHGFKTGIPGNVCFELSLAIFVTIFIFT